MDSADTTSSIRALEGENYRYWRENGGDWVAEYDQRKKAGALYHIQEWMLAEYFCQSAPARVLEFGCGIGRHLRYLNDIAGIEIHGYDQSPTMLAGVGLWADVAWMNERVKLGTPTGALPYPDKFFDVVYTSEVLIHVLPEDIPQILAELLRVAKWHVLHLEPAIGVMVDLNAHNGCWNHDLVEAYAQLGHKCERLPQGYSTHSPHRVVLEEGRPLPQWSEVQLGLMRRLESDIHQGFSSLQAQNKELQERVKQIRERLQERETTLEESGNRLKAVEGERESLRDKITQMALALERYEAHIRAMEAQHRSEIQHLMSQQQAEQQRIHDGHQAEIHRLVNLHQDEISRGMEQHRSEIQRLTELHQIEIQRVIGQHQSELQQTSDKYQAEIQHLIEKHQQDLEREQEYQRILEADFKHKEGKLKGHANELRRQLHGEQQNRKQQETRVSLLREHYNLLLNHEPVRVARRLTRSVIWRAYRAVKPAAGTTLRITATGEHAEDSKGSEVWLLAVKMTENNQSVPLDLLEQKSGTWQRMADKNGEDSSLCSERGELSFHWTESEPALTFLRHPWSGKISISCNGRTETFDLYSPHERQWLRVLPARNPMVVERSESAPPTVGAQSPQIEVEKNWTEAWPDGPPEVVALHVPRWLGVSSSTQTLFQNTYAFPPRRDIEPAKVRQEDVLKQAELMAASGVRHVIFSGGDLMHLTMARRIRQLDPSIRCSLVWHGSFLQFSEDEDWKLFVQWMKAARDGVVQCIGVVKKGMEALLQSQGICSRLIYNYIPAIPEAASTPDPNGPHIGLWISGYSYRKLPFAALSAVAMIPGATLHGANLSFRGESVVEQFEIRTGMIEAKPLPHDALMKRIPKTHLTLYVTFSECCPMLPLESLSLGVPCLIGPASHLFEDNEFLFSRLVVPFPDRADVIAQYARRAIEEREQIIAEYSRYAPAYNAMARESVEEFLRPV